MVSVLRYGGFKNSRGHGNYDEIAAHFIIKSFFIHPPLKIGLTGGIGSGKSTAAKIFELLQVPVYYADEASKRLYHTNTALKAQMIAHFGADIYVAGQLNRSKLAEIVFADKEKLELLNSLVHP